MKKIMTAQEFMNKYYPIEGFNVQKLMAMYATYIAEAFAEWLIKQPIT